MSRIPRFEYRLAPVDVYLQGSTSFLLTSRRVHTTFATGFPVLSRTSLGLTMRLEIGASAPEPDVAPGAPPRRRCDGLAWLSLHPSHPDFAGLRHARHHCSAASARPAYATFDDRLTRLCEAGAGQTCIATLVDELVVHALQLAGRPPVMLDARIRQVMRLCHGAGCPDIHAMAREVRLSTSRLSHLFSSEVGMTFRQYALWLRTTRAWRQVAFASDRSLTDIAHDLGFADAAHMSRSFSAIFGYSPRAFREPGRWRIHQTPERAGA